MSHALFDALEPRCLFAISPVPSNLAVPFTRVVIDSNPIDRPLEKMLADLSGDGRLDAVVGHSNGGGAPGGLDWYQQPAGGPTAGTWVRRTIVSGGEFYEDILPRDMNADGRLDIIASYNNTVTWFQNPGNGGVGTWTSHQIGDKSAHDMVMADLDGDGKMDIATNNSIYFQNTATSWTTVRGANYSRTGDGVTTIDTGHGRIDLAGSGPSSSPFSIKWYENPRDHGGNARTDAWIMHTVGSVYDPNDPRGGLTYDATDINHDGRMDLVTAQNEQPDDFAPPPPVGIAWYEQPTNPLSTTWTRHQIDVGISQVHKTRFGDFNGDGRLDIAYAQQEQSPGDRVGIITSADDGAGNNWYNQVLSTGSGHNVYVADVEGDGDPDMLNAPHSVYGAPKYIELWVNQRPIEGVAPSITQQPASQNVNVGQSVTFTVAASGTAPLSYQWQRDQVNIAGANSASYTISSASANDHGATFRAIVTNAHGSATSNSATLTVTSQPTGKKFLSDLTPTFAANGWGPYERDQSNGEAGANDGGAITLNGSAFAKGLGVHANSELRYNLGGVCSGFLALVGVDDEVGSGGSVVFQVWADGTKLYDSGTMTGTSASKQVSVSVAGKQELRLIVTDSGNGATSDHADWAGARVTFPTGPGPTPAPILRSVSAFRSNRPIVADLLDYDGSRANGLI